jgi:hypothetical protein
MKSRSTKAGAIALVLLAFAVAACGGAQQPASSPAEQSSPAAGIPASAPNDSGGQPPPAPPQAPSTQSAQPTATGGSSAAEDRKAELATTHADLDTASRDVEASQGDCTTSCRALTSLERVTSHFCALASSNSDRDACEDAKVRVYRARARIKASCGTCANGAPLDANAPLTSH